VTRRARASGVTGRLAAWSGRRVEDDSVAESFELPNVLTLLGLGVDVLREMAGAKVLEVTLGFSE
jgi:hypothetical protein